MNHPDDRNLTDADYGVIIQDDSLGRIVQHNDDFDAWDWQGEYLGGFTSHKRAYMAQIEAKDIHQILADAYDNR
jgi:hypothetical protein